MNGESDEAFLRALKPVAEAIGATIVPRRAMRDTDIPLEWEDRVVAAMRIPDLHGALDRLVAAVERDLGAPLADLPREQKQLAVRLLDERGAFLLRRAANDVAELLGVSRITIYNYLNAIEAEDRRS